MIEKIVAEMYQKGAFPSAAASAVNSDGGLDEAIIGNRAVFPIKEELTKNTLFDMASLSKILGPTMISMRLKHLKKITFSEKVGSFFPNAGLYKDVTIFDLLTHQGGFLPEAPLWKELSDNTKAFDYILSLPPLYKKGESVVYSCLGYIILGRVLELITSDNLENLARTLIWDEIGMNNTSYYPEDKNICAPTEISYEDKMVCYRGVVHDETARFLRPFLSGNAGVFSSIEDVEKFVIALLREYKNPNLFTHEEYLMFMTNYTPFATTSRSIGFCINFNGWENLAGRYASANSFGHTGFTGTSIWIDPEKDKGAILLSNRVHPTRENKILLDERKNFHDVIFRAI